MSLDPINLASDLIKIKSITPHGQEAINLIKSILENHGFREKKCDIFEIIFPVLHSTRVFTCHPEIRIRRFV